MKHYFKVLVDFKKSSVTAKKLIQQNINILRLFYHQNTTIANAIIIQ